MSRSGGSPEKLAIERLSSPRSGLDSFQREALSHSPAIEIPTDAKDAVWAALSAQLAAGPPPASTAPPASGVRRAAQAAVGKAWLALPAFVALGVAGYLVLHHRALPPRATPAVVVASAASAASAPVVIAPLAVESLPALSAVSPADPGQASPGALPEASPHHGAAVTPASKSDLEREIALLAKARTQLRSGNAAGAQSTLAQMQTQFPDRALRQERQVLGILAQNALGNRAAARRSAQAFIKAHPESPHDAQLQRLIAQP